MPCGDYRHCTCGPYWSVVPPPPCPVHSYSAPCCHRPSIATYPLAIPGFDLADYAKQLRELADAIDPNKDKQP